MSIRPPFPPGTYVVEVGMSETTTGAMSLKVFQAYVTDGKHAHFGDIYPEVVREQLKTATWERTKSNERRTSFKATIDVDAKGIISFRPPAR